MSLFCDETREDIPYGTPLYMSTRTDAPNGMYSALSSVVIDRIPKPERRPMPCPASDKGLDIHEGSSSRNFNGAYTWVGMEIGGFLFSISEETARKYLPNHYKHFSGEEVPKRRNELIVSSAAMDAILADNASVEKLEKVVSSGNIQVKVEDGPSH